MELVVICESLTVDEEVDFIDAVSEAVLRGDITQEEALDLIDREYSLQ